MKRPLKVKATQPNSAPKFSKLKAHICDTLSVIKCHLDSFLKFNLSSLCLPSKIQISSPCCGFCFPSLSGLEEDSSTPAAVRWRGGREAEWEQMMAKRGNRRTASEGDFLSQLPNLRIISSSVGGKGLKW